MKTKKINSLSLLRICTLLLISIVLSLTFVMNSATAFAMESKEISEEISLTELNEAGNFYTDKVIIVLSEEATRQFRAYTPKDFPEIDCISVSDLTASTVEYARKKMQGEIVEQRMLVNTHNFRRILSLELRNKSAESALYAIEQLKKRNDVISAEPNAKMEVFALPNDPKYIQNEQWGLTKINLPSAWNISTGTSAVQVAVLDSGIDSAHQDLTNRIFRDSPHNTSTTLHRDFTNGTSSGSKVLEPTDPLGHGTHVAGIIGAQGNNSIGMAGVAWDVRLVSLRVFNSSGQGNLEWVTNAVNYAQSIGIPIINFSGGGLSSLTALQTAISSYEGLFVVAAGNDDNNNDSSPRYPASYTSDNIISVGATDSDDKRSNWNGFHNLWGLLGSEKSNYGATSVDIFAPGTDILSTFPDNKYKKMSGTSMATPFVSGVAALLLSFNPSLTTAQLRDAIVNNVDIPNVNGTNPLEGLCVTNGRLNAFKALSSLDTHTHSYTYTSINGTTHLKVCNCGYSGTENHSLVYYFSPTQHWKKCTKCYYQTSRVNHSWHTEPTGRTYCTVCWYESLVQPWSIN